MHFFRVLFGAALACLYCPAVFGYGIDMGGPVSVNINQQYTITASVQVPNQGQIPRSISLRRFTTPLDRQISRITYTAPGETTGDQTIIYTAEAQYVDGTIVTRDFRVYVNPAPVKHSPTISWRFLPPSTVTYGQEYRIEAEAQDQDGNLRTVNIYRDGEPYAFELNDTGDGTPNYLKAFSGNTTTAPNSIANITFTAVAYDTNDLPSETIVYNVAVRSPNSPRLDQIGLTNPYINQVTDIVVRVSDVDSDIKRVALYASADNPLSPDTPFPGGYSITHVAHNHQNPGPYYSDLAYWVDIYDWSGNNTFRYVGQTVTTDNRPVYIPTISASSTSVVIGSSISLTSYLQDPDRNATSHVLYYRKKIDPATNTWGEWGAIQYFELANGINDNTITFTWSPPEIGEYQIMGYGSDPYTHKDITINVVASAPPDTTPPVPPMGLSATAVTLDAITLNWARSTSGDVANQKLFWGPVSGAQTVYQYGLDVSGVTITNLNPGTAYKFAVRAYDYSGNESLPSNEITQTTLSAVADTDGDGLPNQWEKDNGFNYQSPAGSRADALSDPDSDGLTTIAEYNLGSNPRQYNAGSSTLGTTIPAGWATLLTPPANTDAVGVTVGSLAVDKSGAATYSLPIWVSPGTAGMEPKVSLNYSSQSGGGLAGFGWSIGGASAISRGPTQPYIDNGKVHGVDFTADDQFYLDGQRLIKISGVHGATGAEYRTENESFTKVVVQGAAGTGPSWFKAWTKAGLTIEFGNPDATLASNSALTASGRSEIIKWSVTRILDTKGNYILFKYDKDESIGEQTLRFIHYTCNSAAPNGYASVEFKYDTTRADKFFGYIAGSKVAMTKRLNRIVSSYGTTAARDYVLSYLVRDFSNRSLLQSIQELGDSRITPRPQLPALTFNYAAPAGGWQTLSASWTPPQPLLRDGKAPAAGFVDLDADGRPDFVYFYRNGTVDTVAAYFNRPSGWVQAGAAYQPQWPLAIEGQRDSGARYIDYNGDGLVDFVYAYKASNGVVTKGAYKNTGAGFVADSTWSPPVHLAQAGRGNLGRQFIDVDGDGRPELLYKYYEAAIGNEEASYMNTTTGWQFSWTWVPKLYTSVENTGDTGARFIDLNGDGLPEQFQISDTNRRVISNTGGGWIELGTVTNSISNSPWVSGIPRIATSGTTTEGLEITDVNGDGLADIVQRSPVAASAYLNTGTGWVSAPDYIPVSTVPGAGTAYFDVNGDGINDLLWNAVFNGGSSQGTRLGTGTSWSSGSFSASVLPRTLSSFGTPTGTDLIDLNGDGFMDVVWNHLKSDGTLEGSGASLNSAKKADLLQSVVTGLGVTARITYKPLTDSTVYTKETGAPAGLSPADAARTVNIIAPIYVVSQIAHDDGSAGQYPVNYRYRGLRAVQKYGTLGFHQMEVEDGRTLIASTSVHRQDYPYIGLPEMELTTTSAGVELSKTVNTYAQRSLNAGLNRFIFVRKSVTTTKELDGTVTGSITTTFHRDAGDDGAAAAFVGFDDYGNSLRIEMDSGGGYGKSTVGTYTNNTTDWILGRLSASTVTHIGPSIPGDSVPTSVVRKSSFTYSTSGSDKGLLLSETVESATAVLPQDENLLVTTTYAYDAFGNKISATVTGGALAAARTTSTVYTANGRFPASMTNAENHTETYNQYDDVLGLPLKMTGPNGLETVVKYDGFGRTIQTDAPESDGITRPTSANSDARARTLVTYRWSQSFGIGGKYSIETQSSGAPPSVVIYDAMGRALAAFGINGGDLTGTSPGAKIVGTRTWYDAKSRAYKSSQPFFYAGGAIDDASLKIASQVNTYDILDRPTSISTSDDSGLVTTTSSYAGLTVSATNPNSQRSDMTRDLQGRVISRVDNAGATAVEERGETAYVYDPIGNLVRTKVKNSDGTWKVTSLEYDTRGRKTKMIDPNMGTWEYRYNGLGELIYQKDAKLQEVRMVYDKVGRLTQRTEPEGITTWTYDTAPHSNPRAGAPAVWKGKLHRIAAPTDRARAYSEEYGYDAAGRPSSVLRTIGARSYTSGQVYDAYGRPEKTIYPNAYITKNVYNTFGFLQEVRDGRTSGSTFLNDTPISLLYWQADHYSVTGGVDGSWFGNGVVYDRVINAGTGRVTGIISGSGLNFHVQNAFYQYDAIGNLKKRTDSPNVLNVGNVFSRQEEFEYDGLNRLTKYWLNTPRTGAATLVTTYDALGNIKTKTNAGTYVYGGTRPNAVTQVTGGPIGPKSYTYDANGNMDSRGGSTITWTSYNQAKVVADGANNSQFWFDANRQRVIQENSRGIATYYVGGDYEEVLSPGGVVEEKCYIFTPLGRTAVRTRRGGVEIQTRWFHQDPLGSVVAVTDELGRVESRFAYDPWGKRGPTSLTYSRGFTDHEHLEDLGLIHMNGRIYDPVLGRFLSPDPFVQDGGDSQAYNRYSYLGNNPLGGTDPSGYFGIKDVVKIVAVVVVAYFTAGASLYAYGALTGGAFAGGFAGALSSVGLAAGWGGGWAIAAGVGAGFGSSFAGSLLNGGSIGDAFKAGVIGGVVGGISAGVAGQIGDFAEGNGWFQGTGQHFAHGALQGGLTEATGGEFRHGFYAGFFSSAAASRIQGALPERLAAQTAAAAVVGGTASAIGGGKFANGAVSGAFTYLFNWASHKGMKVHQAANANALRDQLGPDEIAILDQASVYADYNQDVTSQYKHALRDLDHEQTVDEARNLANNFVRERFSTAWKLMDDHDSQGALFVFGQALHTLQDATSPSHYGFQGWHSSYNSYTSGHGISHVGHEMRYPGSNSALYRTTREAYSWFVNRKLPEGDLFGRLGHD